MRESTTITSLRCGAAALPSPGRRASAVAAVTPRGVAGPGQETPRITAVPEAGGDSSMVALSQVKSGLNRQY